MAADDRNMGLDGPEPGFAPAHHAPDGEGNDGRPGGAGLAICHTKVTADDGGADGTARSARALTLQVVMGIVPLPARWHQPDAYGSAFQRGPFILT